MAIKDSGERREFSTGAVRDIQEGKGRPTLMPLQVISRLLSKQTGGDYILESIAAFAEKGETRYLYAALLKFVTLAFDGETETMILETAIHFEEGAKKYGENNWQKGLPVNCYLDSAIRHYLKWRRGDDDEPHHRAFVWNIMCCIWEVDYHENKIAEN
jgi:hypothetical protein